MQDWQAMRRAGDEGRLKVRIMAYAAGVDEMEAIAGPGPTPWLYDDRLRLGGVKLYLDGALGSRGAWLKAPYSDERGNTGLPLLAPAQLRNLMSRAAMDDFQVATHAIGDAANAELLDAIEELSDTYTGDRRWRIEHAQSRQSGRYCPFRQVRHHRLDAARPSDLRQADGRSSLGDRPSGRRLCMAQYRQHRRAARFRFGRAGEVARPASWIWPSPSPARTLTDSPSAAGSRWKRYRGKER